MNRYFIPVLVGGALGGIYQYMYITTNESYPMEKLEPKPEAFTVDRASYDIFAKLARFKPYNRSAYREALRRTDALLQLEKVLSDELHPTKPQLTDAIRAETFAHVASKNAQKLLNSITEPTDTLEARRHVTDLDRFLDIHVAVVRSLCKNCVA